MKTISTSSRSAIVDAVKSEQSSSRKWLKVVDNLHADGITAQLIATEKKGGNPELRESVREAVVAGFTPAQQALLAKEGKSLSDAEKVEKRYTQQQVGSMLGHIERLLAKAEKAGSDVVKQATTQWSRAQDFLDKLITAIQNADGVADLHPADAIRTAKTLKGYLPKA